MAEKGDVFPPSNLGRGDPWAYHVQDRIVGLEHDISRVSGDTAGAGRASKAQLSNIASQIRDIREVQETILSQQAEIVAVQNALPVMQANSDTNSPISADSTSFVTKASTSITIPEGKTRGTLSMLGTVSLLDTVSGGITPAPYARFWIDGYGAYPISGGVPGSKDPGASAVNNVVSLSFARQFNSLTPGGTLTVNLQVAVFHATAYATASASNFATLSVNGTFSA